ncbi:hypothetical protein ABZ438_35800 [Streptomyces sp. NPDC005786]|uniref:hypothetical protein n=1 Tax=Streptomyces sp. NPDC005786 TaxID=3154891 RepID=UPI0033CD038B
MPTQPKCAGEETSTALRAAFAAIVEALPEESAQREARAEPHGALQRDHRSVGDRPHLSAWRVIRAVGVRTFSPAGPSERAPTARVVHGVRRT